ncbi:MAG: zinc ribbon domain-containing protein [Candidatus Edwardsbacteria bacterium]
MPIYEFECEECGNHFEILMRSTDKKISCLSCGSEKVRKLFSTFGYGKSRGSSDIVTSSTSASSCSSCSATSCKTCR